MTFTKGLFTVLVAIKDMPSEHFHNSPNDLDTSDTAADSLQEGARSSFYHLFSHSHELFEHLDIRLTPDMFSSPHENVWKICENCFDCIINLFLSQHN